MPRVRELGKKTVTIPDLVRGNIEKYKRLYDITNQDLAYASKMSLSGLYKKMVAPQNFRLKELESIAKKLDVKIEDLFM